MPMTTKTTEDDGRRRSSRGNCGGRGGIDKNLRKIICPKIKFEVWKL
jgi:hypothetical protein